MNIKLFSSIKSELKKKNFEISLNLEIFTLILWFALSVVIYCFLDFSFLENSVTNDNTNEVLPPNINHLYLFSTIAQSLACSAPH